jgi:hypothetical protein
MNPSNVFNLIYEHNVDSSSHPDVVRLVDENGLISYPHLEPYLVCPKYAYLYCVFIVANRCTRLEDVIFSSPLYACMYCIHMGMRIPDAEYSISKSDTYSYKYLSYFLASIHDLGILETDPSVKKMLKTIYKSPVYSTYIAINICNIRLSEFHNDMPDDTDGYVKLVNRCRFRDAEKSIMSNPRCILKYVSDSLRCRWREAEECLIRHPTYLVDYVRLITSISDEFSLVANAGVTGICKYMFSHLNRDELFTFKYDNIADNDPYLLLLYAYHMNERIRDIEFKFLANANVAFLYALHIVKGRWYEGEQLIMKDPQLACMYARDVIKGRWIEAEKIIFTSPNDTYEYVRRVIGKPLKEAEKIIMTDSQMSIMYAMYVMKERWIDIEHHLGNNDLSVSYISAYCLYKLSNKMIMILHDLAINNIFIRSIINHRHLEINNGFSDLQITFQE